MGLDNLRTTTLFYSHRVIYTDDTSAINLSRISPPCDMDDISLKEEAFL